MAVYRKGDYVYPANLPRRYLCRVAETENARAAGRPFQILTLEPLEGPWHGSDAAPCIVRFDADVVPPRVRDLWTAVAAPAQPA